MEILSADEINDILDETRTPREQIISAEQQIFEIERKIENLEKRKTLLIERQNTLLKEEGYNKVESTMHLLGEFAGLKGKADSKNNKTKEAEDASYRVVDESEKGE